MSQITKYIPSASYNPATGVLSFQATIGDTPEQVVARLVFEIEASAQGKRTDVDSVVSEPQFVQSPNYSPKSRTDAVNARNEVQIEYIPKFVLWLKEAFVLANAVAVNDSDPA